MKLLELAKKLLVGKPGSQPGRCDEMVFSEGVQVLMLSGPRSWLIERYVVEARERAGVPIDWHFAGGRAVILAFPKDAEKALASLDWWMPAFQTAAIRAKEELQDGGYEVQLLQRGGRRPPKPEEFPPGALTWDPDVGFMGSVE